MAKVKVSPLNFMSSGMSHTVAGSRVSGAVVVMASVVVMSVESEGAEPQADVSARIMDRSRREVSFLGSFIIVSFHCVPGADGVPSAVQAVRIFFDPDQISV